MWIWKISADLHGPGHICIIQHLTDSTTPDIIALQQEVKNCSERVETLQKELKGLKKDIEPTCKEMDATRSIINEFVSKSLGNYQK